MFMYIPELLLRTFTCNHFASTRESSVIELFYAFALPNSHSLNFYIAYTQQRKKFIFLLLFHFSFLFKSDCSETLFSSLIVGKFEPLAMKSLLRMKIFLSFFTTFWWKILECLVGSERTEWKTGKSPKQQPARTQKIIICWSAEARSAIVDLFCVVAFTVSFLGNQMYVCGRSCGVL